MGWYSIFKDGKCVFDGRCNKNNALELFDKIKLKDGEGKLIFNGKEVGRLIGAIMFGEEKLYCPTCKYYMEFESRLKADGLVNYCISCGLELG
jgi:hypothetical protein